MNNVDDRHIRQIYKNKEDILILDREVNHMKIRDEEFKSLQRDLTVNLNSLALSNQKLNTIVKIMAFIVGAIIVPLSITLLQ